jgi:hypothetical protein
MQGDADAANLTAAALALLEDVAPGLSGEARFKTLMAVAGLKMADRERLLSEVLGAAEDAIMLAGEYKSLEELRDALRHRPDAMTAAIHAALMADAVARTSVTKPQALTPEERGSMVSSA